MNKTQKAQIKMVLQSDDFQAILDASIEIMENWQNELVIDNENQYKTLKNTFKKEYKVSGLREFLDELERLAME